MIATIGHHCHCMNGLKATIGINGFSNGFWSINHWSRWFFRLATIGLNGFAMVFGLATIGLNGFSMVANHWSNDGMVTIHCYGLSQCHINSLEFSLVENPLKWLEPNVQQFSPILATTTGKYVKCTVFVPVWHWLLVTVLFYYWSMYCTVWHRLLVTQQLSHIHHAHIISESLKVFHQFFFGGKCMSYVLWTPRLSW